MFLGVATVKQARDSFTRTIVSAHHLLEVDDLVKWTAGTPVRQQSLYKGIVVLTVSAWQSAVERLAEACQQATRRRAKSGKVPEFALAPLGLERFFTPNGPNTLALFRRAGLELSSGWSVLSQGEKLNSDETWKVIDAWLQVRHSISHGFPFAESSQLHTALANQKKVAARVLTGNSPGPNSTTGARRGRVLNRSDAEGCIELFGGVVEVASRAAERYVKFSS